MEKCLTTQSKKCKFKQETLSPTKLTKIVLNENTQCRQGCIEKSPRELPRGV